MSGTAWLPKPVEKRQVPGHARDYILWYVTEGGLLYSECSNCTKYGLQEASLFTPFDNNANGRKRPDFLDAIARFRCAFERRDAASACAALEAFGELRRKRCTVCALSSSRLSPSAQACKDEYERMRLKACTQQDGCGKPNCHERGMRALAVLEADHLDPRNKTEGLSQYIFWSSHGGPEAMRAEAAKGLQWICACCHALLRTSNSGRSGEEGKDSRHSTNVRPKQSYVNSKKQSIGACLDCGFKVCKGNEVCFEFDHVDPSTKMIGRGTLAGAQGGVGGLVNNHNTNAVFDAPGMRETLDAEMDKCELRCRNCHKRKTCGGNKGA